MIKSFVVITSIFEPTEAVKRFAELEDYELVIAGDRKSPHHWQHEGVHFLSVDDQMDQGFATASLLPYNHYSRKLMGYLYAIEKGAEIIIDTDDDNIPYGDWHFPKLKGAFDTTEDDRGWINIYKSFTDHHIWPRGYPLDLLTKGTSILKNDELKLKESNIGVWQGLADSDPDVDAIYRLVDNTEIFFNKRAPIVLGKGTLCPFNSQNTLYRKELFPLLYLPSFVTFRFTDILRGLVAQPIMWKHGYQLGFTQATVIQKRNPHNYLRDFESEIPCYLHPYQVIELVTNTLKVENDVADDLLCAYKALEAAGVVKGEEIELLKLWLLDLKQLNS